MLLQHHLDIVCWRDQAQSELFGNKLKKQWEELEGRSKEETWYVLVEREYELLRGSGT